MKYIVNILLVNVFMFAGFEADAQRKCGIEAEKSALIAMDPTWSQKLQQQKGALQGIADNYKMQTASRNAERSSSTVSAVPVIFHIIVDSADYILMGGAAGINERVDSQIAVLNRDFNRENSDSTLIPSHWKALYGNVGVHFAPAHTDPSGRSTLGFEILISNYNFLSGPYNNYTDARNAPNGLPAWDNTKYMNVWCINFADDANLLGITTPLSFTVGGGFPNGDVGICINRLSLGCQVAPGSFGYPLNFPSGGNYSEGRTLTHEVGHFFEIWHTWGDDGGLCPWYAADTTCVGTGGGVGGDDGLADTPPEGDSKYGVPAYTIPGGTFNDCCEINYNVSSTVNQQPIGVASLSFLNYTDDDAMHLFTIDQAAAMASMVLVPPTSATGATGSGTVGESYSLTQHPDLLTWPANVGVPAVSAANTFNVFPNPTNGIVNISFDASGSELQQIIVSNMVGQEVVTMNITGVQKDFYSVDLSGMSKGMYFVRCNFATGSITRKILLQ